MIVDGGEVFSSTGLPAYSTVSLIPLPTHRHDNIRGSISVYSCVTLLRADRTVASYTAHSVCAPAFPAGRAVVRHPACPGCVLPSRGLASLQLLCTSALLQLEVLCDLLGLVLWGKSCGL